MKGEIVVVTGGASGIGHACCQVLAKKGWKVVVSDVAGMRSFPLHAYAPAKAAVLSITGINLPVDAGWLVAQGWKTYPGIRGDWP